MHSFAPFLESIIENWGKKETGQNKTEKVKPFSNLKMFVKLVEFFADFCQKFAAKCDEEIEKKIGNSIIQSRKKIGDF